MARGFEAPMWLLSSYLNVYKRCNHSVFIGLFREKNVREMIIYVTERNCEQRTRLVAEIWLHGGC